MKRWNLRLPGISRRISLVIIFSLSLAEYGSDGEDGGRWQERIVIKIINKTTKVVG
jgi:hypothetical protein